MTVYAKTDKIYSVLLSLLIGLLIGVQNIAIAIDCPPGTTPETEPAGLTVLKAEIEGDQQPYLHGGEGIAGTSDGGALATDTFGGRVVKIDPFWGAPFGKGHVVAGGGFSNQDDIPAIEAQLYSPTSLVEHTNGNIFVVTRNGTYGKSIVREIYQKGGTNYIRTIAGGGSSTANYPMPARNVNFGEIQNIISISELTFLVVANNETASVWRVTWSPTSDGSHEWIAWKIVGDGQSGVTLPWASGIAVTRTADGKYQDLLIGSVLYNRILRFTGNWISGKGQMSFASQPISDAIYALVAQPDGSIVFATYDRIQQIKDAQSSPEIIAGGGNVVPPNELRSIYRFAVKLEQVVNLAPVGKLTVTPGTFLIVDRATSRYYMFTPEHEYCNPG